MAIDSKKKESSLKGRTSLFRVLFPLFTTFFLDNFGMVLVLPIFAILILHPEYPLLSLGTSYQEKLFWLSMLIAAYPFAQIFGVPIIGEMADRWGRKKAFSFSLTIVIIGYFFSAISLYLYSLPALLFFRCLNGFASVNWTICLEAFSDIVI